MDFSRASAYSLVVNAWQYNADEQRARHNMCLVKENLAAPDIFVFEAAYYSSDFGIGERECVAKQLRLEKERWV